jgi:hypothetical protein
MLPGRRRGGRAGLGHSVPRRRDRGLAAARLSRGRKSRDPRGPAAGASDQEAARAALAEFGDLATVAGEFTRQAPGRRAARLLLATGPAAGACWAAALITGRAWSWPVPATARLAFGAVLLLAVLTLLAAATSRHSYQRTRRMPRPAQQTGAVAAVLVVRAVLVVVAAALVGPASVPVVAAAIVVMLTADLLVAVIVVVVAGGARVWMAHETRGFQERRVAAHR